MSTIKEKRLETTHRMAKLIIHRNTFNFGGQVGVRGESIEAQTQEVLSRVQDLLETVVSDKSHMLRVIIWLKSMMLMRWIVFGKLGF